MDVVLDEMDDAELDELAETLVALLLSGHRGRRPVLDLPRRSYDPGGRIAANK